MAKPLNIRVIERALEIIRNPRMWTQFKEASRPRQPGMYTFAGRKQRLGPGHDVACSPFEPEATKFCAVGALKRAAFELTGSQAVAEKVYYSVVKMLNKAGGGALTYINDRRGYIAIVGTLKKRLEKLNV